MTDRVILEERSGSCGHVEKEKESVIVNAVKVRDAIAGIPYLIGYALTAMMTTGPDNCNTYGDSPVVAIMQAIVDKRVSANPESVNFKICFLQTLDDIVSSPRYFSRRPKLYLKPPRFSSR